MWNYVFVSASGEVSIGSDPRGRIPAYASLDVRACQRYARKLMTSRGASWTEQTPSVNGRGKQILIPSAAFNA